MQTFELLIDNGKLQDILRRHLEAFGFAPLSIGDRPLSLANFAVIDIRSEDNRYLQAIYDNADTPVIYTGRRNHSSLYEPWLKRPFTRSQFVSVCRSAGLELEDPGSTSSPSWECRRLPDAPDEKKDRMHGPWSELKLEDHRSSVGLKDTDVECKRYICGRGSADLFSSFSETLIEKAKGDEEGVLSISSRDIDFCLRQKNGRIYSADYGDQIGGALLLELLRLTGAISVYLYRRLHGCISELASGLENWLLENEEIEIQTLRQMCRYRLMWCWHRLFDQPEIAWQYQSVESVPTNELDLPIESLGAIWERRRFWELGVGSRELGG